METPSEQSSAVAAAAFEGIFLDGAVDMFDLAVGPEVIGLAKAVLDAALGGGSGRNYA